MLSVEASFSYERIKNNNPKQTKKPTNYLNRSSCLELGFRKAKWKNHKVHTERKFISGALKQSNRFRRCIGQDSRSASLRQAKSATDRSTIVSGALRQQRGIISISDTSKTLNKTVED